MEQQPVVQRHKIFFVGTTKVGKTALIHRYIHDTFSEEYEPTQGIDFMSKSADGKKLQFWDTAGQEKYRAIIPTNVESSSIVAFVYDVTIKDSLTALSRDYLPLLANSIEKTSHLLLIGNKTDLPDRQVSTEEGEAFALNNGMMYLETSALNFDKKVFLGKIYELLEKYNAQPAPPTNEEKA